MSYDKLDADELLRLGLDAMQNGRDADAVVMLKTLLERTPDHAMARYLLAAQYAQLGLMDRAEEGFRAVVARASDFPMARFQLGQLLLTRGAADEVEIVLTPLVGQTDALAAYARAMVAAARSDFAGAIAELRTGLGLSQDVPALTNDMSQLLDRLLQASGDQPADAVSPPALTAPIFLTGYGQGSTRDD